MSEWVNQPKAVFVFFSGKNPLFRIFLSCRLLGLIIVYIICKTLIINYLYYQPTINH